MIRLTTDADGCTWLIITRRDGRVHGRNLGRDLLTRAELALICVLIVGGMAWWVVGDCA